MADGADAGRRWIAVTLKGLQKETIAQRWMENAGFLTVLPMERYYGRKRRGRRERYKLERIAIRGYLFVEIPVFENPGEYFTTIRSRVDIVRRPVGAGGLPLVIHENWLSELNPAMLDPDYVEEPRLKVGDTVQLSADAGVWSGFSGQVENINGTQLKILIKSLQVALSVSVPEEWATLAA